MTLAIDDRTEWLETDGTGGFASGTTSGIRTRRYHALLLPATTPPTGRVVLLNGVDVNAETAHGSFALSTNRYTPDVLHPDGASRIDTFSADPWPTWEFALPGGVRIRQELFLEHGTGVGWMAWALLEGSEPVRLRARPFLSGRDYHALHHENGAFDFNPEQCGATVTFRPYDGVPPITLGVNGAYRHEPQWYRNFLYAAERDRGLDDTEDLASPGELSWDLSPAPSDAILMYRTGSTCALSSPSDVAAAFQRTRTAERHRRLALGGVLDRAADAYLVRRGSGRTIVAGYPWFTDWGRDTFIAVRGLCLATGRLEEARDILVEWAGAVSEGMLPNRFPDRGESPEFNSVDASLWYVVAVGEFLQLADARPGLIDSHARAALTAAVGQIVGGYAAGTRYGIRIDSDALLAAGVPGQQLTWMDARVGERVITPRVGKAVEIQALWYNAVAVAASFDGRWSPLLLRIRDAFFARFWCEAGGRLADVVAVDHVPGTRDDTMRPNQVLAIGGLPLALIGGTRARRVLKEIEAELLTPLGLRSLTPMNPAYVGRYAGGPSERDSAYHQGTVWPWLIGPFVEGWVRAHGNTAVARQSGRKRFLEPVARHLREAGIGHLSEIADAEAPFTARGCPFQAWSLAEYLRLDRVVLQAPASSGVSAKAEAACV